MKKNHIYSLTFLGILIFIISCKDDDENSLIVNCGTVSISQTKEMPGIVGYDVIQTTDCNYLITGISDNGSTLLTKIDGLEMNYGRQVLIKYQVIVGGSLFQGQMMKDISSVLMKTRL